MKAPCVVFAVLLLRGAIAEESNPLGKVFELLKSLQAKIIKQGEAEEKAFKEFFEWCDDASKNVNFAIKTASKQKAKLTAKIGEYASDIEVAKAKIEDLANAISQSDGELQAATGIRQKEAANFAAAEKELTATVDSVERALSIISTEMAKNPAALAQIDTTSMSSMLNSLSLVVDAAAFNTIDKNKLTTLVQEQDEDMGAPAAATYKTHSSGILDLLEDLKEKAEAELAETRKAERKAKHSYDMMKKSLEDQMAVDNKNLANQKSAKEAAGEAKATAEGDLAVAENDLKKNQAALATANGDCMTSAGDHESTVAARNEELKVIATAEKILKESTGGAGGKTSFIQMAASSKMQTSADSTGFPVLALVKTLAHDYHSTALAQLADRVSVVTRYSRNGADVFGKIKGLIQDMINKLEKEASAEATEKAYCDEQTAKSEAKKAELEDGIAKLTVTLDKAAARSTSLKEEVTGLEAELAKIAEEQAMLGKIRAEDLANYKTSTAVQNQGLTGVRKALDVLRTYYGASAGLLQEDDDKFSSFMQQPAKPQKHEKSSGAGGSIISILEVCESDFATSLAKTESQEADSAANYEKVTQENKVSTATKTQDAKFKTKEAAGLDKQISELSSDRATSNTELAAVVEFYGKIKERCVAGPQSYEERKARRAAEIEGLKEALSVLENQAAFIQRGRKGSRRSRFMAASE